MLAFRGHQRFEPQTNERCLFANPRQPCRFLQQTIVYVKRCSHMHKYALNICICQGAAMRAH